LSVAIGSALAETEAAQGQTEEAQAQTEVVFVPKSAIRDLHSGQLARPWQRLRHLDDLDASRGTNSQGVLMRMLSYYEIRSEALRLADVLTKTNAAQLTTATHRRKQ
jgi:hypothetical protein